MNHRRMGRHRARPALSAATHAKRECERLDRLIAQAKDRKDAAEVTRLEEQKQWAIINAIPRA